MSQKTLAAALPPSDGGKREPDWERMQREVHEYKCALLELLNVTEELTALRAVTRSMPVVNMDAYARRNQVRAKLAPLARISALNGEQRAVAVFDTFLASGVDAITDVVGDDVVRVAKEMRLDRGRVDRALFHQSGRLTLVEIKDSIAPREVVAGIGQVLFYAAVAERTTTAKEVVPVLAVLGERDVDVSRACSLAGVAYIPLGDIAWLKSLGEILNEALHG